MTSLPEERFILKGDNPNQWIDRGLYFFWWEKTRKKAQAIWFKNTLLLPQNKWGLAPFILKLSLSYTYWRDCRACSEQSEEIFYAPRNARSAFLTVFSPYSLRQAFLWGRSSFFSPLLCFRKSSLSPFFL